MGVLAAEVESGREGQNREPSVGPVYRHLLAKNGFRHQTYEYLMGCIQAGPYLWKTYREIYEEVLHIGSTLRASVIVCFTSLTREQKDDATCYGIKSYSWNEFLRMGKENLAELSLPQPLDICTIMYTSETSGDPKGVVLTHENHAMYVRGIDLHMDQFEEKMTVNDVYLSFLPLAHILDRMLEEYFFHKGASVGYYQGDINALKDDLMEMKPTFFAGVPRVFKRVHEGVMKALEEASPIRTAIFNVLYKYKLAWMKLGYKQKEASPLADLIVFHKINARFGGRVHLIVSGGAPLSNKVEEFLRVTSCAFVAQGYDMGIWEQLPICAGCSGHTS